jgi:hypothetical protein
VSSADGSDGPGSERHGSDGPGGDGPGSDGHRRPLAADYRALRPEPAPGGRARHAVARQVEELGRNRTDEAYQRQASASVSSRYQERRNRRLRSISGQGAAPVLLVDGELLVTDRTWADAGARSYLLRRGLVEAPLGCDDLEPRLTRLVTTEETTVQALDDTVGELRARGFAASLTHVTTMASFIKSLGGPALGESLGAFAQYPHLGDGPGEPIRVAVVDTGIDGRHRTDGWLESVTRRPADDPATHGNDANVDLLDLQPHDGLLDIAAGHGTFVAGIIAQVAPTADISVYRALRAGGAGSELEVACALVRAVADGAQVVNLSLGGHTRFDQPSLALAAALDEIAVIERRRGEEVVIVAAAGNYGDQTPTWPAAFRRVVAVGAVTADLRPATWSTRGFWVDCSTVGEGLLSTFVQGSSSFQFTADPDTFGPDAFAYWSGTSFSAPQIAGAVARLARERSIPPRRALAELLAGGRPVPGLGQAIEILPGL